MIGSSLEYHNQHHRRKDIVIKYLETINHTATFQDVSVTADMKFFWVNTHSERDDFIDERVCMRAKLHMSLIKALKECALKDISREHEEFDVYLYKEIVKHFIEINTPFDKARDWISLDIKSISMPLQKKTVECDYGELVVNPYYKDNSYFRKKIFPVGYGMVFLNEELESPQCGEPIKEVTSEPVIDADLAEWIKKELQ
jgi:hypothetical protein